MTGSISPGEIADRLQDSARARWDSWTLEYKGVDWWGDWRSNVAMPPAGRVRRVVDAFNSTASAINPGWAVWLDYTDADHEAADKPARFVVRRGDALMVTGVEVTTTLLRLTGVGVDLAVPLQDGGNRISRAFAIVAAEFLAAAQPYTTGERALTPAVLSKPDSPSTPRLTELLAGDPIDL